jgi:2-phosphosulfolactate phosphatase
VRAHVAFTPDDPTAAPTGIVIDVIRATSTISTALASGYERVFCSAEVSDARRLRDELEGVTLGGERLGVRIEGFDLGNSPQEHLEPLSPILSTSTTNGTRAIVAAAARCERVYLGSLLNLAAVTRAAAAHGEDVVVVCAGVKGQPCIDDTYVAGRIVQGLACDVTDAAEIAVRLVGSFASAEEAFRRSRSGMNLINHGPELEADIPWCARESVLDVVPRFRGMHGVAVELVLR